MVALIKENKARGVFVKTLSAAVALNNIACVALFEVARTLAGTRLDPSVMPDLVGLISGPLIQIGSAILLGGSAGALLVLVTRHEARTERLMAASFVALLLVAGTALALGVSVLLSGLFLGVALANLTPNKAELGPAAFQNVEAVIFAAFFTLAGIHLDFSRVVPAGITALVLIGARFAGKNLAAALAMRWAGATKRVRRYLGLALTPQAGVAVGLILLVRRDPSLAAVEQLILAVGLTTVMVNEIAGSILAHVALARSGESGRARPRLIDFLHEENIVTELTANTKEEAIAELTDVLIETHHLHVNRHRLLRSVLDREQRASTCLGNGLAIPHGILEERADMHVAMGISRRGLDFDTPEDFNYYLAD